MLDGAVMGYLLLPLGHQCHFKSLEVTTHTELVKEVICWILVFHEHLQVLEHLKRKKGQL